MSNGLELNISATRINSTPERREREAAAAAPKEIKKASGTAAGSKILRFAKSERIVHWSIAVPFLVSFASALILVVIYNPDRSRPYREFFAELHRISGVALIVLPMLATLKSRGDARLHFYNIKQAWTWVYDDFMWLALLGLAAINSKIKLPEQGKFNAAEKLNFMVLMTTYPLYVATGLLMWLTHLAILAWILHFLMAMLATPLLLGHLYMALINPSSRKGLEGMISGHVDRQWAKHHYHRWYKEHYDEAAELPAPALVAEVAVPVADSPAEILGKTPLCCDEAVADSPADILERMPLRSISEAESDHDALEEMSAS